MSAAKKFLAIAAAIAVLASIGASSTLARQIVIVDPADGHQVASMRINTNVEA